MIPDVVVYWHSFRLVFNHAGQIPYSRQNQKLGKRNIPVFSLHFSNALQDTANDLRAIGTAPQNRQNCVGRMLTFEQSFRLPIANVDDFEAAS